MSRVNKIYGDTVKKIKNKVVKDLTQFLERKETPIPFQQYLEDRDVYLAHIWNNLWQHASGNKGLPEPIIKKRTLEELELFYNAIGLHLLFLYKLKKEPKPPIGRGRENN